MVPLTSSCLSSLYVILDTFPLNLTVRTASILPPPSVEVLITSLFGILMSISLSSFNCQCLNGSVFAVKLDFSESLTASDLWESNATKLPNHLNGFSILS
eukprot:NODE_682_length_4785_cov_0.471831.p6 type:complete len:100 gc:universal NODE_682_length_4785_cov_0.471831:3009-3308(+)